jgi:hypothetical protein
MTAKPNNVGVVEGESELHASELHAVEWVRGIRDRMYASTSTLSAEDLIRFVRQAAGAAGAGARRGGGEI